MATGASEVTPADALVSAAAAEVVAGTLVVAMVVRVVAEWLMVAMVAQGMVIAVVGDQVTAVSDAGTGRVGRGPAAEVMAAVAKVMATVAVLGSWPW